LKGHARRAISRIRDEQGVGMVLKSLMDVLTFNYEGIAAIWIRKVRKAVNLKTYNTLSDEDLIKFNAELYHMLALWFEKEADKNKIGAFFVGLGKERRKQGYPVSEVTYALLLVQKSVLEYLTNESMVDSTLALYQIVDLTNQVADYFFLGSYYMMKGYLEDTYLALNKDEALPADILKKYFRDDFFFKDAEKKGC
jgi:hypothetical protein